MNSYAQGLTRDPWKPELAYSSLMSSSVEVIWGRGGEWDEDCGDLNK